MCVHLKGKRAIIVPSNFQKNKFFFFFSKIRKNMFLYHIARIQIQRRYILFGPINARAYWATFSTYHGPQ